MQLLEIVRFVRRAVRRHWRKGATVGGVGCLMTLVAALQLPQSEFPQIDRTPGSFQFLDQQAPVSKAAWQATADPIRDAKQPNIVDIEGQRKELETQLGDTANQLRANQADLARSAARIVALESQIAALPQTFAAPEVATPNASVEAMRQSLILLEAQQKELAAKMTESHPKLAAVRQKVVDLRKMLDQQPKARKSATETPNPARQSLELTLRSEQSQADLLRSNERTLQATQQDLRGSLAALNASTQIEQLQPQVTLAETNDKDDASLSPPVSHVAQAARLRRSDVLFAGLLLSVGSAVSTVLLAAWLNPIVTTAQQLTAVMNLPVTGVVPHESLRAT